MPGRLPRARDASSSSVVSLEYLKGEPQMPEQNYEGINRWWRVVGALLMNLSLGSLYAWSIFVAPLEKEFGWNRAQTSVVFTVAVFVFAMSFVIAGRLQDKLGPFRISLIGAVFLSLGLVLAS